MQRVEPDSPERFYASSIEESGWVCDVEGEIRRCIQFEEWLESTPPERFISPHQPRLDEPLTSVILPMFNASRWIETTLKSLLLQKENIEIFCVDDASTDDAYERVQRLFGADGRICLVRLEKNVGPYQIRNWVAAHLARGAWLAFQDADDLCHPNRFVMQKNYMARHQLVACGTSIHQVFPFGIRPKRADTEPREHEGRLHTLAFYSHVSKIVSAQTVSEVLFRRSPIYFQRNGTAVEQVSTTGSPLLYATLRINRSIFLEFGGFEGRSVVEADKDFVYRLVRFHEVGNVPAILYTWRIHGGSLTQALETGYESILRRAQQLVFHERERDICRALENSDQSLLRQLCTSDLYHADLSVDVAQARFALPRL